MHAKVLNKILEQPDYLTQVSLRTLQNWVKDYPHVALFRVFLAKKLQDKDQKQFKSTLQNASFFVNDRLLLYQFMQKELIVPEVDYDFLNHLNLLENPDFIPVEQEVAKEQDIQVLQNFEIPVEDVPKEVNKELAIHEKSKEEVLIEAETVEKEQYIIDEEKEVSTKLNPAEEILQTLRQLQEARKKLNSITGEQLEEKEKILHDAERTLEVVEQSVEKTKYALETDFKLVDKESKEQAIIDESVREETLEEELAESLVEPDEESVVNESEIEEAFIEDMDIREDYQPIIEKLVALDELEETQEEELAETLGELEEESVVDEALDLVIEEVTEEELEFATQLEDVVKEDAILSERIDATVELISTDEYVLQEALGEPEEVTETPVESVLSEDSQTKQDKTNIKEILVDAETHSFMEWLQLLENQVVVQKIETHAQEEIAKNEVEEDFLSEETVVVEEKLLEEIPVEQIINEHIPQEKASASATEKNELAKKEKRKVNKPGQRKTVDTFKQHTETSSQKEVVKMMPKLDAIELDERILPVKGRIKRDQEVDRLAVESVSFNKALASETLAKVFAAQGKKMKAIEVYKILILKFPNKKRYFATQIKNLQE